MSYSISHSTSRFNENANTWRWHVEKSVICWCKWFFIINYLLSIHTCRVSQICTFSFVIATVDRWEKIWNKDDSKVYFYPMDKYCWFCNVTSTWKRDVCLERIFREINTKLDKFSNLPCINICPILKVLF